MKLILFLSTFALALSSSSCHADNLVERGQVIEVIPPPTQEAKATQPVQITKLVLTPSNQSNKYDNPLYTLTVIVNGVVALFACPSAYHKDIHGYWRIIDYAGE